MKKKLWLIVGVVVAMGVSVFGEKYWMKNTSEKKAKSEDSNITYSLATEIDKKVKNFENEIYLDNERWFSSNPYDFKDTTYYKDLLSYGLEGVSILEEKFTNGETGGMCQYLVGLAIQDVTETDLAGATGEVWMSGEDMSNVWENFVKAMPENLAKIVESEKSPQTKLKEIEYYGVFGKMYVKDIVEETQSSEMLHKKKIKCAKKDKERFQEYVNQNPLEQKQLEQTKECFEEMYNRHKKEER